MYEIPANKATVTKNNILSDLALIEARLGESRREDGRTAEAGALFADSARKYAHVHTFPENEDGRIGIMDKALASAVKSDDASLKYQIAMGHNRVLNEEEYVPRFGIVEDIHDDGKFVPGVRRIGEKVYDGSSHFYLYRVNLSPEELDRLSELSAQTGSHYVFEKLKSDIVYVKDNTRENFGIVLSYKAKSGHLRIFSDHSGEEDARAKELVNSIALTLEVLIRS